MIISGCAESGLYPIRGKELSNNNDTALIDDTASEFTQYSDDTASYVELIWPSDSGDKEEEIVFTNIAPLATPTSEDALYEYSEWALNDNDRSIQWYSKPQYFTWNPTWVQLQWEEDWNVTYLDIYWDDDLFAAEIEIFYQQTDEVWVKWNEYSDYESVTGNFSRFLLAKNLIGIYIKMEGSSNLLSTYSIKEIEVTGAQY